MRIRAIKPEFYLHEALFDLEHKTNLPVRLAFTGLWCAADREGLFKWEPRKLKASILPYDDVDFSALMEALAGNGFIIKYAVEGQTFGAIANWKKHQFISSKENQSVLPKPPAQRESDLFEGLGNAEPPKVNESPEQPKGDGGRRPKAKSLEEVKLFAIQEDIPALDAAWAWDHWEGNGWTNNGKPIRDWQSTLRSWRNAGYLPSQKCPRGFPTQASPNAAPPKPVPVFARITSVQQLIAAKKKQLKPVPGDRWNRDKNCMEVHPDRAAILKQREPILNEIAVLEKQLVALHAEQAGVAA